jgi:hypothetical protein
MRLFWTRTCRGCSDSTPHNAHLTWFGRLYFRWWRFRRSS